MQCFLRLFFGLYLPRKICIINHAEYGNIVFSFHWFTPGFCPTPQTHPCGVLFLCYDISMSNVIQFIPPDAMKVEVDLEDLTLADVINCVYENYDISECVIVYRDRNGEIDAITDVDPGDSIRLLEDFLDYV